MRRKRKTSNQTIGKGGEGDLNRKMKVTGQIDRESDINLHNFPWIGSDCVAISIKGKIKTVRKMNEWKKKTVKQYCIQNSNQF